MTVSQNTPSVCEDISPQCRNQPRQYTKNRVLSYATRILKLSVIPDKRKPTALFNSRFSWSHRLIHPQDAPSGFRFNAQHDAIPINSRKKRLAPQALSSAPNLEVTWTNPSRTKDGEIFNAANQNKEAPTRTHECKLVWQAKVRQQYN